ncbi:hypothetical protein ACFQVC_38965 [Streptomyces monticola]|uniref:GNAT family N-acetyltransferase n=1 Tax=Streptomyces monticola TaxID=2666263 RepID=A0ABW2JVG8_9ACTN
MAEVFLRRLSRWQADQQREAIADLYVASYRASPDREYHDRRTFLLRFAQDVQRPGFDMLIASETSLVGAVYGYPPSRDGEWWRGLRVEPEEHAGRVQESGAPVQENGGGIPESGGRVQEIEELTLSGRVFTVAELMVLPSRRRTHIADRLQKQLLVRVNADLVTTLLEPTSTAASAAYAAWGWTRTGRLEPDNGRPPFDVWSTRTAPAGRSAGSAGTTR